VVSLATQELVSCNLGQYKLASSLRSSRRQIGSILTTAFFLSFLSFLSEDGLEGCSGGDPVTALLYTSISGLAEEDCVPYTSGNGTSVPCDQLPHDQCTNATYSEPFEKHYSEIDSIRWHPDEASMQAEIFANGPIETCFEVYEDFVSYSSGVYQHLTGNALGGHCVKVSHSHSLY